MTNNSLVLAMVITYPHLVMRTRLQDNRKNLRDKNAKVSFFETLKLTYQNEGIRAIYSGLRVDLVRVLPANAITFVTFEFMTKKLAGESKKN